MLFLELSSALTRMASEASLTVAMFKADMRFLQRSFGPVLPIACSHMSKAAVKSSGFLNE